MLPIPESAALSLLSGLA